MTNEHYVTHLAEVFGESALLVRYTLFELPPGYNLMAFGVQFHIYADTLLFCLGWVCLDFN